MHVGYTNVSFTNVNVSDKNWHQVDIAISLNQVQVNLDKCQSITTTITNYQQMLQSRNESSILSLGGIPPSISTNHYYYNVLNVFEYDGCIRNLRINGDLRDLALNPQRQNLAYNIPCSCDYTVDCTVSTPLLVKAPSAMPWWIILILLGALICLGKQFDWLVLNKFYTAMRSKKFPPR